MRRVVILALLMLSCSKGNSPTPLPPAPPAPVPVPCYKSTPPPDWVWFYEERPGQLDLAKIKWVPCKGGEAAWVYFVSYGDGWWGTAGNNPTSTKLFLNQEEK